MVPVILDRIHFIIPVLSDTDPFIRRFTTMEFRGNHIVAVNRLVIPVTVSKSWRKECSKNKISYLITRGTLMKVRFWYFEEDRKGRLIFN